MLFPHDDPSDSSSSQSQDSLPFSSAPAIVMVSPPTSQDDGNDSNAPPDAFHTATETSSLPSSGNVVHCTVNSAADIDAGTKAFIDLGTNNGLGFSHPNPTAKQIRVARVPETESSHKSSKPCGKRVLPPSIRVPVKNGGIKLGSRGEGHEKEKISVFDVFKAVTENTGGGEAEENVEGVRKKVSDLNVGSRKTVSVKTSGGEDEDDPDGLGLLRAARQHGITFPRPRWWPEGQDDKFDILKICER